MLRRYRDDEEGGVVALSLYFFIIMLLVGGLGIDMMRYEMERTHLQATLDNAVLAGAGAPAGTDKDKIKDIVEDYFAKNGMSQYLNAIKEEDIETTLNSTRVTASGSMTIDTYLMKLSGVKTLNTGGLATAEVRTPKLEIVLVLDVSGSMASNYKIQNLKSAAKEFVTTVISASEPGNTVISIVPFSFSVTPTQTMFDSLAVDVKQPYSTCLNFKENDYSHAALTSGASAFSSGIPVNQMIYTSVYGNFDDLDSSWRSCYTDDYIRILPYSISESDLHNKIDALQPDGNTSGNQGMNWGAGLMDPTFRDVSTQLIDNGEIDASLTNVPTDYGTAETLKVIIMMGDGANTTSYYFDKSSPKYRGAHSDLFNVTYQEQEFEYLYPVYDKKRRYYYDHYESYCSYKNYRCEYSASGDEKSSYFLRDPNNDRFWNMEESEWIEAQNITDFANSFPGYISHEQLSWEMAWGLMSPRYYGERTGDWRAWNDYVGSEYVNGSMKDARMQDSCTATKTNGVLVYSIGFEVPQGGNAETQLRNCASSPAHYYRASGVNINDAFSSIASNVQNLRLTQ